MKTRNQLLAEYREAKAAYDEAVSKLVDFRTKLREYESALAQTAPDAGTLDQLVQNFSIAKRGYGEWREKQMDAYSQVSSTEEALVNFADQQLFEERALGV